MNCLTWCSFETVAFIICSFNRRRQNAFSSNPEERPYLLRQSRSCGPILRSPTVLGILQLSTVWRTQSHGNVETTEKWNPAKRWDRSVSCDEVSGDLTLTSEMNLLFLELWNPILLSENIGGCCREDRHLRLASLTMWPSHSDSAFGLFPFAPFVHISPLPYTFPPPSLPRWVVGSGAKSQECLFSGLDRISFHQPYFCVVVRLPGRDVKTYCSKHKMHQTKIHTTIVYGKCNLYISLQITVVLCTLLHRNILQKKVKAWSSVLSSVPRDRI